MKYFLTFFLLLTAPLFGQTLTGQRLQLGASTGSGGVLFTQSNGSITIAGTGNGTDENITVNLNAANVATFSSSTGVATLNFSGFALTTTGVITGVGTGLTGTAAGLTAGTASAVAVGGITGLGTGVGAALAINTGSAGAPVLFNGAGGTPSSMVGTNITGTAAGLTAGAVAVGGITGLGTNVATALAVNVGSAGSFVTNGGTGTLDLGSYTTTLGTLTNALFSEAAAPGTPAAGKVVVYAKADGLIYGKDDAGTETVLSGGAGAVDTAAVTGSKTWSDGSTDTGVWTWNRATGTDPTITFLSGGIGVQSLTNAALTSGRVTFAGASGILTDDADFTFSGDTLTATKIAAHTQVGAITADENAYTQWDSVLSADGKFTGNVIPGTAGAALAFGDLIYLDPTDSKWELVDANSAAAADGDARGIIGMCVTVGGSAEDAATLILLNGTVRADAAFPALTVNAAIFVSETAGDVTNTSPVTSGNVVRVLGYGIDANSMYFNPASGFITYVP